jgi:hypothetical protein
MPTVPLPFPCAVYARQEAGEPYCFSHFCEGRVDKSFPASLRVRDLAAHDRGLNCARMLRAPFLVLAAGERAQCISVDSAREGSRPWFLYTASPQSRPCAWPSQVEEIEPGFVSLAFCSTLALFRGGELRHVAHVERGLLLLPSRLREGDLRDLARYVARQVRQSIEGSVWLLDDDRVNEAEWFPHSRKRKLFYNTPELSAGSFRAGHERAKRRHVDALALGQADAGHGRDRVRQPGVVQAVGPEGVELAGARQLHGLQPAARLGLEAVQEEERVEAEGHA